MNYNDILNGLQSTNSKAILNSLIYLATYFDENEINSEIINLSFQHLLPHIASNHYKIRTNSIIILSDILENFYDSITDVIQCIPDLLNGLHSVNSKISENCLLCINQIIKNDNPNNYWSLFEHNILNDRSLDARIQLIKIIEPVSNSVPLNEIIKLLDDTNIQIRKAAVQFFQSIDASKLKETLKSTSISCEGMNFLFQNYPELGDLDSFIDCITNAQNHNDDQKISIKVKTQSSQNSFSNGHQNRAFTTSAKNQLHTTTISKAEKRKVQKGGSNLICKSTNKPKSSIKNLNESSKQKTELLHSPNSIKCKPIVKTTRTSKTLSKVEHIKKPPENRSDNNPQNGLVEHNELNLTASFDFDPHNLENLTWLERIAFLDSLSEYLSKSAQLATSSVDLIDCVLTVFKPLHPKITFKIPPILLEILLRNPEALPKRLFEITQFALITMMTDDWRDNEGFNRFLSTIILETDPQELIETALRISNNSSKKLPFEQLIKSIYDINPDLKLPYYIVSHILSAFLKQNQMNESQREIFSLIISKEIDYAKKYCLQQTPEQRSILSPFLSKNENTRINQTKTNKNIMINIPDNESQKIKMIENEFKLGAKKGNLKKCILTLLALKNDISMKLFTQFVTFIGKFKLEIVSNNVEELTELCCSKFGSSQYLHILDADWIPSEIISGISRIIWYSSEAMLEHSEQYLPILYNTFRESSGRIRIELVKIVLGIEKATKRSILDLPEVVEPYRQLIISIASQFQVQ